MNDVTTESVVDLTQPCCEESARVNSDDVSLPPGIKTEAVLAFLGNISQALIEISNGINRTVTSIITEGSQQESTEGEDSNDTDG